MACTHSTSAGVFGVGGGVDGARGQLRARVWCVVVSGLCCVWALLPGPDSTAARRNSLAPAGSLQLPASAATPFLAASRRGWGALAPTSPRSTSTSTVSVLKPFGWGGVVVAAGSTASSRVLFSWQAFERA
jgi:hypothetical protein